ncbi:metal-independent alpha-mannosidase (plasmid) [Deinococcus psychrotolerans]|uniref:Metal-independent alpha-mannosidase n=1 Tax=Deinococcus psychrotolerans TaxID=2489213 RepID=A0A3G8YJV5_9DEIO|nr:metal-independent alpha-mannosidase [Deinococcus psychrotolerans]
MTFERCFPNSLETTLQPQTDGKIFVVTGDIPAIWRLNHGRDRHPS